MNLRESNEVGGHAYRMAQAHRLERFCRSEGVSADELMAALERGLLPASTLDPICGTDGKIQPEAEDFEAVGRG